MINPNKSNGEDGYRQKYDKHYEKFRLAGSGDGPSNAMGLLELSILRYSGLEQDQTLLDFGCGVGRLAKFATKYLSSGRYIGSDISEYALREAEKNVTGDNAILIKNEPLDLNLIASYGFAIDYISIFSVFTHMELEDTYNLLVEFRKISSRNTKIIASFLTLESPYGAEVFLEEAKINYNDRYKRFRNISNSKNAILKVFDLANWKMIDWINEGTIMNKYCVDNYLQESEVSLLSMNQSVGIFILK